MFSRTELRLVVAVLATMCLSTAVRGESTGVAWRNNLDAAKIEAAQTGRLLLLHFWTQSCAPCKVLDQNVLSQGHVGAAVEQSYVPVKIDADSSPALAQMLGIDRVPMDVVLTPQGNIVATLSAPDTPDAYVAQLENVARHFRQTTPDSGAQLPPQSVNAAYASLPQRIAVQPQATAAATATPQSQSNPYVMAAPTTGQTQVYATSTTQTAAAAGSAMTGGVTAGSGATTVAAGTGPAMPTNAMPRSYRDPFAAAAPAAGSPMTAAAGGATIVPVAGSAAPVTPPPAVNSAYAAVGTAAGGSTAIPTNTAPTTTTAPPTTSTTTLAGAPTQAAQVQPMQPPLPPNCPPVAFDGCCPVTLKALNKWAPGNTAYGAIHRGRTYLFVGEDQRHQFLADPDAYSPVFAGYDPVLLLDKQQTVPGTRKFGFKYGNAFYLFSCAETRDKFQASPQTYAAGVRQAMALVDAAAGTIRR